MNGKAGFKRLNSILGWVVFAIALVTYTLTMEKTASLWDCGEFISGAYKLEIVHPPGAPVFILFGRIFTLFAFGNELLVADMVNFMSALSTAFVALFGFWSITMLAGKLLLKKDEDYTTGNIIATLGAGLVGGLSITFLDSLWFSALEGEVYALSMFFMTFVVWAALRWDRATGAARDRWLLTIAFAVGLSLGVHLLSMLVMPFFGLVYYFNRYKKQNLLGATIAIGASFVVIGFIMKGIISGIPSFYSFMDRIAVNSLGLPFNAGVIMGSLLIVGAMVAAVYYARKRGQRELQTAVLSVVFILIGYSTFLTVPIRSAANPPINMNKPDDPMRMLSYLNREQYGVRPLLYGPRYDANPRYDVKGGGEPIDKYYKDEDTGEYGTYESRSPYVWKDDVCLFFPRLAYFPDGKKQAYRHWVNATYTVEEARSRRVVSELGTGPGALQQAQAYADQLNAEAENATYIVRDEIDFGDNIKYFFQYHLGYMYGRYFMWNFAGRQNDKQGTFRNSDGGWLSGIPIVDDHLPLVSEMWGNVRYPQTKLTEARKDEDAYNRFFMIPFILGLIGLVFHFRAHPKAAFLVLVAFLSTGVIYLVYANEPPVEPRERDYVLVGSFFMYCFWIGMGVVGIYKGLSQKLSPKLGASIAVVIGLIAPVLMGSQGWDDHNRSGRSTTIDFATNYLESCEPNAILFTQGDNDTYPLWYAQEVEGVRTDVRVVNLSLLGIDWYINQLRYKMNEADPVKLSFTPDELLGNERNQVQYINLDGDGVDNKSFYDLKSIMQFVKRENKQLEKRFGIPYYLPTKKVSVAADLSSPVIQSAIGEERKGQAVENMQFKIRRNALMKNDLIALDIVANNINERPIYFAVTVSPGSFLGLQDYFQQVGLAYRVAPLPNASGDPQQSPIHLKKMYDLMMNTWQYGGIKENPNVLMDENTQRMVLNAVSNFTKAAQAHVQAGKNEEAIALLDKCLAELPLDRVGHSFYHSSMPGVYYQAGAPEKGEALAQELLAHFSAELEYLEHAFEYEYQKANPKVRKEYERGAFIGSSYDAQIALYALSLLDQGLRSGNPELASEIKALADDYNGNKLMRP